MSVTSRNRQAWESFWREASDAPGAVFWDAEATVTAQAHLALLAPHFAVAELPVVDLGCGNGTQTRFLAGHYPRVTGVDLSDAAVGHARRADPAGRADYRQVDAVDGDEVRRLHAELGDTHVYMRGVLHQCAPEDRQPLLDGIAVLLGERGRAFVVELAEAAGTELRKLAGHPAGPPPKLAPVFAHGLTPGEVRDADVPAYVAAAGLTVLDGGELPLITTEYTPDGVRVELSSHWLVLTRAR